MQGKSGKDVKKHPSVISVGKKFGKFCLVGGVGFLIAYSLLWIFTEKVGLWYMYSALVAQAAATIWNFTANLKWTFRSQ